MQDDARAQRLRAGEVLIHSGPAEPGQVRISGALLVHSPVERIWNTIISCAAARRYVEGMRNCEVLVDRGDYARTHQVVDRGWLSPRFDYVFETRRKPHRWMQIRLVKGNLDHLSGRWVFLTVAEGIVVTLDLELAPAAPVPRWLVRRHLRRGFEEMLRCIRALAEQGESGAIPGAADEFCPGTPQ